MGAKLVEQKQVQRTAFETKVEATSDGSVLASTANNVSSAYETAFKFCCQFAGVEYGESMFKLNTEFDIARMTPEERKQAIQEWQSGAITFSEYRAILRKAGIATEDDDKAKQAIADEQTESLRRAEEFSDIGGKDDKQQ